MKPSDFFIGLVDLVAIILPGAILAYLLLLLPWPDAFADVINRPLAEAGARWAAFVTAAYTLGHVLHHIGGWLDHIVYDEGYKKRREDREGEPLMKQRACQLVKDALRGQSPRYTADAGGRAGDNLFAFALAAVRVKNPAAAAELDRAGVDSKFFRSLAIVGLVAAFVFPLHLNSDQHPLEQGHWVVVLAAIAAAVFDLMLFRRYPEHWTLPLLLTLPLFVILFALEWPPPPHGPCLAAVIATCASLLLIWFSLRRYCQRRWMAAEQTYRFFVILNLLEAKRPDGSARPAGGKSSATPGE